MGKKRDPEIPVTPSSGNVFADLGFAEPKEELAKAHLASHIRRIIRRRRLTQVAAAALMGIDQPKVSALLNGRLASFSTDRLMRLLTALGQDVEIVVKERESDHERGRISVVMRPPERPGPAVPSSRIRRPARHALRKRRPAVDGLPALC